MNEKIAILGGAFNPIHLGHLLIAQNALKTFSPDRILFIPCSIPPDKSFDQAGEDRHRVEMIRLAIQDEPRFELSTLELERGGRSYSVDTLHQLQELHPRAEFFWILGSDRLSTIGTWHQFSELVRLCTFWVIERPGASLESSFPPAFRGGNSGLRFQIFTGPTLEVSSTQIRQNIKLGKNVSHLVPSAVYQYIRKYQIYQNAL